ncbi:MAG: MlaE family lipid ABC transporter permease subunit [Candidatus Sumerlaeia bacterium]|nr:MlaE family lipid ABC transporter permease subunit [Candidatus Sumerlaeia bacterium]
MPMEPETTARIHIEAAPGGAAKVTVEGELSVATLPALWAELDRSAKASPGPVVVDCSRLARCDLSGVGLLLEIDSRYPGGATFEGASEELRGLIGLFDRERARRPDPAARETVEPLPHQVGKATVRIIEDLRGEVAFVGELASALGAAAARPGTVRWKDALRVAERAGVDALPIVLLVGFLMGLIMAFQGAVAMKQFGAEIFIANLTALAILRELGPLMTAIVFAGRSASAFAAEIGTMKVNDEVNALKTMGLEPVSFLAVPRVVAGTLAAPLLAVFANLAGLFGGLVVMLSLRFPAVTFWNQVMDTVTMKDLLSGLFKAVVFGFTVSAVGCLRGLQTALGSTAVGVSTTRAVVTSILFIVLLDGLFAVVFYILDI